MSAQIQQAQQPPLVYPNIVTRPPPSSSSSSHSNGSFGTVFIVLAVIVVISAIACLLGRLCNRRFHNQQQPPKQNHQPLTKDQNVMHHKEWEPPREKDLEFGFDKRIPSAKPGGINGEPRGFIPSANGNIKGKFTEFRPADDA